MTVKDYTEGKQMSSRLSEREIVEYLRKNPEFFNHHPELLVDLKIPHDTGGAVSLIERQISVLRDDNRQLRQRIRDLVEIARENDALMGRLHELSLNLIRAKAVDTFFLILADHLKRDFAADLVAIKVFANNGTEGTRREFISPKADGLALFDSILARKKPVCGRFNQAQLAFLFDEVSEQVGSAAVVPLVYKDSIGMFAVASHDKERFRAGMSTLFLSYLGEIGGAVLHRLRSL